MEPGGSRWRRIALYEGDSDFSGFIPGSGDMVPGAKVLGKSRIKKEGSGNSASLWIV
jgi:hypothetical protein